MLRISDIENAQDALTLAQAREGFKAWSWIAERRESRLYGAKQEVTVTNVIQIDSVLDGQVDKLLERIAVSHKPSQVIDLPSDAVQHVVETKP